MRPALAVSGAVLAALAAPAPLPAQATDWKQIVKPPLRAFTPPQPKRVALPNGMVVFLMEDHELPLIRGFARIRGGSREEPGEKAGLMGLYGQVWRTGGTKARTGDQLDDFLEARAARVETGGGLDSTVVSFDCLKASFEEVFPVFLEVLRQPEFRQDKLELAKSQLHTGIARRNDNAAGIAAREARRLGYGPDSPYARNEEYATVAAVTRDDLLAWHRDHVHPNNVLLGVTGDFDSAAMEARLRKAFASWPKGPPARKVAASFPGPKPGVYFVPKEDVNQSNIRLVHLGTTRDNPDYHALEVMNEVFGGGFSARLFSNVRSKKGLAYNVGGGVGSSFDYPGLFMLSMGTKSESTAAAIEALYEEIDNLRRTPATEEELKRAKDAILNSFIFRFDSRQEVMGERMLYEFYGYPLDFLERYRAGVEKVTTADVARVAEKYVHRDKLALLVVGKAEDFDKPLSAFGPVTTLDVSIPLPGDPPRPAAPSAAAPPAAAPPAAAASDDTGKALLAKVIEGMGGAQRVGSIKSLRVKSSVLARSAEGDRNMVVETVHVFPDRARQQADTPMGTMSFVVSPEASFMVTPAGTRDIPSSQKELILRELRTQPLYVAQHQQAPSLTLRAGPREKVGEVEAQVLEVALDGAQARWWVDPASGRILKSSATMATPQGPSEQISEFSDFRTVDGFQLPFKRSQTRNGEFTNSSEVQEIELNLKVEPQTFARPPQPPPQ
jgi:zinc protease